MSRPGLEIVEERSPGPADIAAVLALIAAAAEADGMSPVSEPVLLELEHGHDPRARHFLARRDEVLVGYAFLDPTDQVAGPSAELVVNPPDRRAGVAGALLDALEAASPDGRLRLWAHGRHAGAVALAHSRGYAQERVLWQMRRSLLSSIPDEPLPAGIRLRPFVVGQDEQAWVEVNNRAFAGHPEQGGWTVDDVRVREQEPWFDPAGFLLAERTDDGGLVGFHWTKVHNAPRAGQAGETASAGRTGQSGEAGKPGTAGEAPSAGTARTTAALPPIGEVYVLGVDPSAGGLRLGSALTVAGLRYLRGLGLSQVMLYVDDFNDRAVRLYERLGFRKWDVDVQFRRAAAPS